MAEYVPVLAVSSLAEGELTPVEIAGRRIVLAKVDGVVYAVDGYCTHERFGLDQGELFGHELVCGLHFASFDIRTGAVLAPPAEQPLACIPIVIQDGVVYAAVQEVSTQP
jgi:3-phenylpropionate/trans-cinnamate dioxygenase ferredoxin subunit